MESGKAFPGAEARIYEVELTTLLRKRSGWMELWVSGGRFSGILGLMKAENPVQGQLPQAARAS